ncbi:DUF1364 family protein [Escherichia coli]|nr:DUF1364 family protein [Escherichia coli]EFO1447867.1 DUF1364 family protein [Escherichia coli]
MGNYTKKSVAGECLVWIYGVCNGNTETIILTYYRTAGICGTGMKLDALLGL